MPRKYAPASPRKIFPNRFNVKIPNKEKKIGNKKKIKSPDVFPEKYRVVNIERQYPSNSALNPSIMLKELAIPTKAKIMKARAKISNFNKISIKPISTDLTSNPTIKNSKIGVGIIRRIL